VLRRQLAPKVTIGKRVGRNLKKHRIERGLTLNQLAGAAGVAKATLSKLESGDGNPTIATLEVLANSLGLPTEELLTDSAEETIHVSRAPTSSGAKEDLLRLIDRLSATGMVEIFEDSFKFGTRRKAPPHPPGVVEHLLLVEGALLVGPVGHEVNLAPGDYVKFKADVPHAYRASGGLAKAVIVLIYPVGALSVTRTRRRRNG
jgi:transcriptional regulator with XRE-family HTH domain